MNVSMLLIQPPGCHNPINVVVVMYGIGLLYCMQNTVIKVQTNAVKNTADTDLQQFSP